MFEGLKRALALKAVRWAATLAAGAVAGFLASHTELAALISQACATVSDPAKLSAGIVSLAVGAATLFFSMRDGVAVNAKVVTAAATGSTEAANNPAVRADTMTAIKAGVLPCPSGPAPNLDDLIEARRSAARGGG